ncbi:MAG: hypothetical protein K0U66_10065 [Gammaproteobacteria bacterium]|nr:hypothetical protein [Gammaproteobacteria bacterium]
MPEMQPITSPTSDASTHGAKINASVEEQLRQVGELFFLENPEEVREFLEENLDVLEHMHTIKQICHEATDPRKIRLEYFYDCEDHCKQFFVDVYIIYETVDELKINYEKLFAIFKSRLPKSVADKIICTIKMSD